MNLAKARLSELRQLRKVVGKAFDNAKTQRDVPLMEKSIKLIRDLDRLIDLRLDEIARTGIEIL